MVPVLLGMALFHSVAVPAGQFPPDSGMKDRMTACIHYKELMLIVSDSKGVGAVMFTKEIKDGVEYRYRYQSKDGKIKQEGTGKVFEKFKRLPRNEANKVFVINDGGQLYIEAGPLVVEWSYSSKGMGCLYYRPERIHI